MFDVNPLYHPICFNMSMPNLFFFHLICSVVASQRQKKCREYYKTLFYWLRYAGAVYIVLSSMDYKRGASVAANVNIRIVSNKTIFSTTQYSNVVEYPTPGENQNPHTRWTRTVLYNYQGQFIMSFILRRWFANTTFLIWNVFLIVLITPNRKIMLAKHENGRTTRNIFSLWLRRIETEANGLTDIYPFHIRKEQTIKHTIDDGISHNGTIFKLSFHAHDFLHRSLLIILNRKL